MQYRHYYEMICLSLRFVFFNDTATTEIYTLSLHDALPICYLRARRADRTTDGLGQVGFVGIRLDRKSTRLNSSHANISYAVFCLTNKPHTAVPFNTRRRCPSGARAAPPPGPS